MRSSSPPMFGPNTTVKTGLRRRLESLFRSALKRDDARTLPPCLLRDIGLHERNDGDWKRDLL